MKLYIVGIGPGNYENMTVRADRALQESQVIVGYPVYVDLVKDRYPDRQYLSTAMTQEAERCRMAHRRGPEWQDRLHDLLRRQRHLRHGGPHL